MAKEQGSFGDLVDKAPPAPSEGPVSLVGTLAKSNEEGKFVLILPDGGSVKLNIADVKSHTVLGNSLGLNVVQVEVEADVVRDLDSRYSLQPGGVGLKKIPAGDPHKSPIVDNPLPTLWTDIKLQNTDPIVDYRFGPAATEPEQLGAISPFALATAHQAPASTVAALQAYQAAISQAYQYAIPSHHLGHITGILDILKTHADPRY